MKKTTESITLLLICSIFFFGFHVSSLTAQRVSRCEDLGLNPIEPDAGEKLLAIYLEGDGSGIGGHGCWVHHHSNGTDYVVTPHSWGRDPDPGKKGLIEDAMQAITDSRTRYAELGDLSTNLYYILDDINRRTVEDDGSITNLSGEAFWLIGEACWMRSGAPTLRSAGGLAADRGDRKQTFAHEIGHCFVMKNVPDIDRYYDDNHWFDESVSEYLSSLVYPTNDLEHDSSVLYDMDGVDFRQEYNAYVLWYYIAKKKGISQVLPLMNRLATFGTLTDRLKFLRRNGYDKLFHEFLFDFYKNEIYDSGGTGTIPREDSITLRQTGEDLITDPSPPVGLVSIPSARLSLYELYIPADYDLIIEPPVNSSETAFFSLLSGSKNIRVWDAPEKIEGNCGSFTVVNILSSHLQDDPVTGSKIIYRLEEREGCCEAGLVVGVNPDEKNIDGEFSFDHYIESYVNYKADGTAESIPMNYYVNSKDGSMLLTKSWFSSAFGRDSSGGMEAEAVIWLANGQIVTYVTDRNLGQKRAITLELNQTSGNIMARRALEVSKILNEGRSSGLNPEPLPPGSPWNGQASGVAYNQPERSNPGQINKISAYISNATTPISSPLPSFGFMAGYIRASNNKNKKLVYTRFDTPAGDMFEVHLNSIEKKCFSFNGDGYKKMVLAGGTGAIAAMSEDERNNFADNQIDLNNQMLLLIREMADCGDNKACVAEVEKRMMELERQKQDAVYNLSEDSNLTGSAGSDFQQQQIAIRDEMYALHEQIIDKEVHCDRLSRSNASCGGCMNMAVEQCDSQLEGMKDQLAQLECKMAKLHGMGDMMDDCE